MKRRFFRKIILLLLLTMLGTVLSGCAEAKETSAQTEQEEPVFQVYLTEDTERYSVLSENPVTVKRGEDAVFSLQMKEGFRLKEVLRQDKPLNVQIQNGADGMLSVRIPDIRFGLILSAECAATVSSIAYHPNGGRYLDGSGEDTQAFTVGVSFENRLRPNTERGTDRFERPGYILIGWNTKADGSGEHTGLGSRVTVPEGSTLDLYAEWAKESPETDFTYRAYGKGWTVTGYTGSDETVVLPSVHDGKPVDTLAKGAFSAVQSVQTVILPPSVETVAPGAFSGCPLEKLYLFDNIKTVSDAAFADCPNLSTVFINAAEAPRFGKNLYSEYNLADKYDLLILNRDKRKLVVFGGSGAYNSLNTTALEEQLKAAGEDYLCLNVAVNGWFNGAAQLQMIRPYLKEGDLFLHEPETSSRYSLLNDLSMTPALLDFEYNRLRFYACLESNYDLISLIDLRTVTDFFDGLNAFNLEREEMPETSYTDYKTEIDWYDGVIENPLGYMDGRGNLALPKRAKSAASAGEADLVVEYLENDAANERLNAWYDSLRSAGISVFFVCTPVNADMLEKRLADPESLQKASDDGVLYYGRPEDIPAPDYGSLEEWVQIYEETLKARLQVVFLLPLSESLYHGGDFFEPDYHLSDEAGALFTEKVGAALIGALKGGNKQ